MIEPNIKIINASAGSGKTFSLVKDIILTLLINDENTYKKILALTFTNNAANEMKKRVLDELYLISKEIERSKTYELIACLLYTSPSPRDRQKSRMPSSA